MRKLEVKEQFQNYNFIDYMQNTTNKATKQKLVAMHHLKEGRSIQESAYIAKLHRSTVTRCANNILSGHADNVLLQFNDVHKAQNRTSEKRLHSFILKHKHEFTELTIADVQLLMLNFCGILFDIDTVRYLITIFNLKEYVK